MSVKKYECAELIMLVIPVAALVGRFFLQTRMELGGKPTIYCTLFNEFAVSANAIALSLPLHVSVGSVFSNDVYYCPALELTQDRRFQLVTDGINVQLPFNDYKIRQERSGQYILLDISPSFDGEFFNYVNNEQATYIVEYFEYNTSKCAHEYTGQRYVVIQQPNIKPVSTGFNYKFEVSDTRSFEVYADVCGAIFIISIFVVIFWTYLLYGWNRRKQKRSMYLSTDDNAITVYCGK